MYIKPKNNYFIVILKEGFKVTGHSKIKFSWIDGGNPEIFFEWPVTLMALS